MAVMTLSSTQISACWIFTEPNRLANTALGCGPVLSAPGCGCGNAFGCAEAYSIMNADIKVCRVAHKICPSARCATRRKTASLAPLPSVWSRGSAVSRALLLSWFHLVTTAPGTSAQAWLRIPQAALLGTSTPRFPAQGRRPACSVSRPTLAQARTWAEQDLPVHQGLPAVRRPLLAL